MACFKPLEGFRGTSGGLCFSRHKSTGLRMTVPCGQCTGCRLERSRQWAVRCMHEASLYDECCFVTLTYRDEDLPRFGSLVMDDWQNFFKRLRRRIDGKVRYFGCGEYGSVSGRPHYHALLFGLDFADKVLWTIRGEHSVFRSVFLESVWTSGHSEIGSVTFESAAYVARYCVKKVTGKAAEAHYACVDPETGEMSSRLPEFATMSRRPGIGTGWFEKFGAEVYPSDEVIVRGSSCKPPRFYDKLLAVASPEEALVVQKKRILGRAREDETPARLHVREVCADARLTLYQGRDL